MAQNSRLSFIEAIVNTGAGMVIAWSVSLFILMPLLGIPMTAGKNTIITIIFTILSVIRGFVVRRVFTYLQLKKKYGNQFDRRKVK